MTRPGIEIAELVPEERRRCVGVVPLTARLASWQVRLYRSPGQVRALLRTYGSPVHVHSTQPFLHNLQNLRRIGEETGVALEVFFARKANKCLSYVTTAASVGAGVDIASDEELRQALDVGVEPGRVIVTAAVKPRAFLERCVEHGILVALDNLDESCKLAAIATVAGRPARIAVRLGGFRCGAETLASRFGFPADDLPAMLARWRDDPAFASLRLEGLHFHLDGYRTSHRISALDRCLDLADELGARGTPIRFLDLGGGFPMSYLARDSEWVRFWAELEEALRGRREPITYRNHGYGLHLYDGRLFGEPRAYPHAQRPVAAGWLREILAAPRPSEPSTTLAAALRRRRITLCCEPGRALLDGCGATIARVEHRKHRDGDALIGLHMNSSNCRSKKSELFVDPLLIPSGRPTGQRARSGPIAGYLTGAYCTEGELIVHRKLRFGAGVVGGDCVLFPNTAGYLMHFVESRSHQFPLPMNVVLEGRDAIPRLDDIDAAADSGLRAQAAAASAAGSAPQRRAAASRSS